MNKYILVASFSIFVGCEKEASKHFGEMHPAVDLKEDSSNSGASAIERDRLKIAKEYDRMLEEKSRKFLSKTGAQGYVAIRNEVWGLGEAGLIDYSNHPEYREMLNTKDLNYRLTHHPNFIFDARIFNLLREAKIESPEVRFRIGYLVLLRLANHPKKGISLWDTTWKNIGPPSRAVEAAVELMSEVYGEDLEKRAGPFTTEMFDLAEKWVAENPLQ